MSTKKPTPKYYQSIVKQYPRYMAALDAAGEAAASAGPPPEKTRHLVQLGAAAGGARCHCAHRTALRPVTA